MSFYIYSMPPNSYLPKKSLFLSTGYCGYQDELSHHHKCLITSYSIIACSVSRCTGGFCYSPHSKRKGGEHDVIHRIQREISFEYLQENTSFAPHSMDEYFILQDNPTSFVVNGQTVIVDGEKLAKALLCLSESWREIILMRYHLQLRDKQIGVLLGKPRTTVNYQKNASLKQLRTEMEKMNDEE